MKPGYEYTVQQRSPLYETSDYTSTGQAELRARGIAFGRPRGAGNGHTSPAARAAAPRPGAATQAMWDDWARVQTRMLELGA